MMLMRPTASTVPRLVQIGVPLAVAYRLGEALTDAIDSIKSFSLQLIASSILEMSAKNQWLDFKVLRRSNAYEFSRLSM